MKYKLSIAFLLSVQINLSGQAPNPKFQLPNDILISRFISINGDFWGQVPAFQKIDESDSVHFETESGLLHFQIAGLRTRDKPDQVIISLFVNEIQGQNLSITAIINKKKVKYQIEAKGFGSYSGKDITNNEYKIITRIKLISPGYPDYYLEFPAIVQITPIGNVDNVFCFIPDAAEHFRFFRLAEKKTKNRYCKLPAN